MTLFQMNDQELLSRTKQLAQKEREALTQILQHLREIERRRLFSDLGYASLFEYTVRELRYSEGQAGRRIQAMRLIKELPEIESKIASGTLSLSNISQAQSFFKIAAEKKPVPKVEKREVLKKLENKSAREGQKELLKLEPMAAFPKERERAITEAHSEVRFVLDDQVRKKLEEVRSLLGPKGAAMSFAELLGSMADISAQSLKAKKFGKYASEQSTDVVGSQVPTKSTRGLSIQKSSAKKPNAPSNPDPRYISKKLAHFVWQRDRRKCTKCGSTRNLNMDHIRPVAKGGRSIAENLRLLCFSCNQREGIKEFGLRRMRRGRPPERKTYLVKRSY